MIPSSPCEDSDPCCDSLHNIALHLLSEVYEAVLACYPTGCCEPLAAYVTLGRGDDGLTDALTVSAGTVSPSLGTQPGSLGLWRATFTVMLRESGWPTARVEGDAIVLPSAAEQSVASRHVFSMGEAIHRRLAYLSSVRGLVPSGVRCSNASIGPMVPVAPQGGVTGWQVDVIVDLPWN